MRGSKIFLQIINRLDCPRLSVRKARARRPVEARVIRCCAVVDA